MRRSEFKLADRPPFRPVESDNDRWGRALGRRPMRDDSDIAAPGRSWHDDAVRIEQTELADVLLLIPQPFRDDRGLFTRTFDVEIFEEYLGVPGAGAAFLQDSQSRSGRGVVRGMHGRRGRGEAKLVRCAHGAVFDVLVDIRPGSPSFGRQQAFRLDDAEFHHLYVPPGFLHGFQALTTTADVCYRIDRPHDPAEDIGVAYDDPDLGIEWPLPVSVVSPRDASAGSWEQVLRMVWQGHRGADSQTIHGRSPLW